MERIMKNKLLYQDLPDWVFDGVRDNTCCQCGNPLGKETIIAIGIRQVKKSKSTAFFVEHKCHKCGFRSITSFGREKENNLENMCHALLRHINKKKVAQNSLEFEKNTLEPMTDQEVGQFIKFVQNNKTHADFLKEIKANPNDNTS